MEKQHCPSTEDMKKLLIGKKIIKAVKVDASPGDWASGPYGVLTLDDGTKIKVWGNDGGCTCGAGDYPLEALNAVDNVINNVEVVEAPAGDNECKQCKKYYCEHTGFYRIYVFADARTLLASFEGDDGNGYYGTGWWLQILDEVT